MNNKKVDGAVARYYTDLLRMQFNNKRIIGYYQSMEHNIIQYAFDK